MEKRNAESNSSFSSVLDPTPGWYRGDFHVHTNASHDGTYPLSLVAALAKAEGLDFCAITDHNTIDAFTDLDQDLACLILPGLEVTFKDGHFNVFGIDGWRDWMRGIDNSQRNISSNDKKQSISLLMEEIAKEGLLNSINHPWLSPWDWKFGETDLSFVDCIEIWNDPYWPDNIQATPMAIAMWTSWLNAGHRVTAIGGSDYHCPPRPEKSVLGERLGLPSTYVYAEELSVIAILEGLKQRQVYVTRGPKLAFEVEIDSKSFGIGADLGVCEGAIEVSATIMAPPTGARALIVKNGDTIAETLLKGKSSNLVCSDLVDSSQSHWYRLDVFDHEGALLAITNPIFVGSHLQPEFIKYKDLII